MKEVQYVSRLKQGTRELRERNIITVSVWQMETTKKIELQVLIAIMRRNHNTNWGSLRGIIHKIF